MSLVTRRSGAEVLESRRRMLSLRDPRREGSRSTEGRSLNRAWVKGSRSALILLGTVLPYKTLALNLTLSSRESWRRTNNGNRQKAFPDLPSVKDLPRFKQEAQNFLIQQGAKPFKFDLLGDFAAFDSKLSVVPTSTTMRTLVDTTQKPILTTAETTPRATDAPEIENNTTMKVEETVTTEKEGLFFTFCCGVNSRTCLKASQVKCHMSSIHYYASFFLFDTAGV